MTKRRRGRKAKSTAAENRRLKTARNQRSAEVAERNDWSLTAHRRRAKGRDTGEAP
jgi:hypothetical protein